MTVNDTINRNLRRDGDEVKNEAMSVIAPTINNCLLHLLVIAFTFKEDDLPNVPFKRPIGRRAQSNTPDDAIIAGKSVHHQSKGLALSRMVFIHEQN